MNKRMIQLQIFKKFLPVLHCSGLILTSQSFPVTLSKIATLHVLGLPWRTVTLCYVTCLGSTWRALTIANNIFFPGATHALLGTILLYLLYKSQALTCFSPPNMVSCIIRVITGVLQGFEETPPVDYAAVSWGGRSLRMRWLFLERYPTGMIDLQCTHCGKLSLPWEKSIQKRWYGNWCLTLSDQWHHLGPF